LAGTGGGYFVEQRRIRCRYGACVLLLERCHECSLFCMYSYSETETGHCSSDHSPDPGPDLGMCHMCSYTGASTNQAPPSSVKGKNVECENKKKIKINKTIKN